MNPTPQQADEAFNLHVEAPLHRLAPLTILHELFEQWGNLCSPQTDDEGNLPANFLRLQIGSELRFFHEDDLRSMLRELHAAFMQQHQAQHSQLFNA